METLRIFLTLLCVTTITVSAQSGSEPIELVLKLDPVPGQVLSGNLAPYNGRPFYLVIKNGEAFLAESEAPKQEVDKHKGTVQFIYRNGIDPATKMQVDPIFELRFRYVFGGWGEDKFVTEIVVPYSVERRENKTAFIFSKTATEEMLSEAFHQGSFTFIGDAMDIRFKRQLGCLEVSSKLNFHLR